MNRLKHYPCLPEVGFIGDPHLGRRFRSGVPKHRLGERERSQIADFRDSLMAPDPISTIVMVGDLFENERVSNAAVLAAIDSLNEAVLTFPDRTFIMMEGNHDAGQVETETSFDLFCAAFRDRHNVHLVRQGECYTDYARTFTCVAWSRSGYDFLADVELAPIVIGHWDVVAFGENTTNAVPRELLQDRQIITGHDHVERIEPDGLIVTGSMQPYSHSQDRNGEIYLTLSLDDYMEYDAVDLVDKCIRVIVPVGVPLPEPVDCRAFHVVRVGDTLSSDDEDEVDIHVDLLQFDVQSLIQRGLQDAKISDRLRNEVQAIFLEHLTNELDV